MAKLFNQLISSAEVTQLWIYRHMSKYIHTFLKESCFYFKIWKRELSGKKEAQVLCLVSVSALDLQYALCNSITLRSPGAQRPWVKRQVSRMENSAVEDQVNGHFKFIVIKFHDYYYSQGT